MTSLFVLLALSGPAEKPWARARYDFAADNVTIWSEPDPDSDRRGLGQVGEQFESVYSEQHSPYRCDDNFESTLWHHGRNLTTEVVGWVPACALTDAG